MNITKKINNHEYRLFKLASKLNVAPQIIDYKSPFLTMENIKQYY